MLTNLFLRNADQGRSLAKQPEGIDAVFTMLPFDRNARSGGSRHCVGDEHQRAMFVETDSVELAEPARQPGIRCWRSVEHGDDCTCQALQSDYRAALPCNRDADHKNTGANDQASNSDTLEILPQEYEGE